MSQMFRFLLKGGTHQDEKGRRYKAGDVIEAAYDLAARWGKDKFQIVYSTTPVPATEPVQARPAKPLTKVDWLPKPDPAAVQAAAEAGFVSAVNPENAAAPTVEDILGNESEPAPHPPVDTDSLDTLTVAKLRALADERGIDVTECGNKAEIVNTIRAALSVA